MCAAGDDGLRPFQREYTRHPAVVAELMELLALPRTALLNRIGCANGEPSVRREALIYLYRERGTRDRQLAERIATVLTETTVRLLSRYLAKLYWLNRTARDDLRDDMIGQFYMEWACVEPETEFWEANFLVCVKRKLGDAVNKRARAEQHRIDPVALTEDDDERNYIEDVPDVPRVDPTAVIDAYDRLARIAEPQRTAFFLFYHDDLSQEEIARRFSVGERTIRNWLRRVHRLLEEMDDLKGV